MTDQDPRLPGVTADSSPDEIRAVYKRLVWERHPDRGGSAEAFNDLHLAYREAHECAFRAPCPACDGRGSSLVTNGFSTLRVVCEACLGSKRRWRRGVVLTGGGIDG